MDRLETKLEVYLVGVSEKKKSSGEGQVDSYQLPHSLHHHYVRATSSILCVLAIQSHR